MCDNIYISGHPISYLFIPFINSYHIKCKLFFMKREKNKMQAFSKIRFGKHMERRMDN